jgi:hypothetical protein
MTESYALLLLIIKYELLQAECEGLEVNQLS